MIMELMHDKELIKEFKKRGYKYTELDMKIDSILIKNKEKREKIKLFNIIDEIVEKEGNFKYFR